VLVVCSQHAGGRPDLRRSTFFKARETGFPSTHEVQRVLAGTYEVLTPEGRLLYQNHVREPNDPQGNPANCPGATTPG